MEGWKENRADRIVISPTCTFCKHEHKKRRTCDAFPEKIPDEIWDGTNDHTQPYPGDNGIQYELDERYGSIK